MDDSSVFVNKEKLTLTEIVELLRQADTSLFTICFTSKVERKDVLERLEDVTEDDFDDVRYLAKLLVVGKEKTIVARFLDTDEILGKSLLLDMGNGGRS